MLMLQLLHWHKIHGIAMRHLFRIWVSSKMIALSKYTNGQSNIEYIKWILIMVHYPTTLNFDKFQKTLMNIAMDKTTSVKRLMLTAGDSRMWMLEKYAALNAKRSKLFLQFLYKEHHFFIIIWYISNMLRAHKNRVADPKQVMRIQKEAIRRWCNEFRLPRVWKNMHICKYM